MHRTRRLMSVQIYIRSLARSIASSDGRRAFCRCNKIVLEKTHVRTAARRALARSGFYNSIVEKKGEDNIPGRDIGMRFISALSHMRSRTRAHVQTHAHFGLFETLRTTYRPESRRVEFFVPKEVAERDALRNFAHTRKRLVRAPEFSVAIHKLNNR